MFFKKMSEEARFTSITVIAILMIPVAFYLVNLFTVSESPTPKPREMTVIVTEAEKNQILSTPPQSVINSVREAIKQGNNSTAYMQIGKAPKDSPEYEELRKALEKEAKIQKRPGIKKVADNPQNPVRYFDESSPREKSVDALYVYLVDIYGTVWPRISIQSSAKSPINITDFSLNVDGKTFTIQPSAIKTENFQDKVAEYYDALLDKQSYTALQALLKSRKAVITCIGTKGVREREISEKEKKGLARILDAYVALGGNFAFLQPATPVPAPHVRYPKTKSP